MILLTVALLWSINDSMGIAYDVEVEYAERNISRGQNAATLNDEERAAYTEVGRLAQERSKSLYRAYLATRGG